ncbi:hypothetical protein [Aquisalimonas asiatica]|uniref:Sulfotransferase family protein n=1 Tax=Aquisalimonas asiatica TaxID=406100 RepID=A0A1H8VH80_9GAMM|nr:hypothetical protein [Aquisalimonas asiatica]SEP14749.1 hypothetical protein SAMN04488052_11273 [Aquisalimonas asiatica]
MSTTRKKLILHVGLHKTGTTYFQRAVWPNWQEVSYAGKPAPERYPSPWQALEHLPAPVLLSSEGMTGSLTQSYLEGNSWLVLCGERISTIGDTLRDRFEIFPILTVRDPGRLRRHVGFSQSLAQLPKIRFKKDFLR